MRKPLPSFSLIVSSLFISNVVSASPLTVKDWSLDDTGASCVASTSRNIEGQNYRFELSLDKSGNYPVEAWIREVPSASQAKAFRLTTEVKPLQNFAFAPIQDSAGNVAFWQIPGETEALVSYIKRQTRLVVHGLIPNGADVPISKTVDFSLRGSGAIVDTLVSQCNRGKALVSSEFEKNFVPPQAASLDPLSIDESKAAQLRAHYQNSVILNAQKMSLQNELAALNSQYAKQIQELSKVTGTLDQLTQKELASLQTQKTELEARIQQIDQQLSSQQQAINTKEAEVVVANGVYDQAWKVIAPLEPEHRRLGESVQRSKNDLQRSQDLLADVDGAIQDKNSSIMTLENEVSSLRHQLSRVEAEMNSVQIDVQNTETAFRRFDSRREHEDRIADHPVIRYCEQMRNNLCDRTFHNIFNDADREVSMIRERLSLNVDWAQNNLNQRISMANQVDARIRNLLQYDIPSLRSQVSDLFSQRAASENSVIRFRDDVSAKTSALRSYDQSVNYAAKKADVEAKSAAVVKLQSQLKDLEQEKASMTKSLAQKNKDLASTHKKIQDVLEKIRLNQDRSSELSQALVPYFAEKSRIDGQITQVDSAIQIKKQEFSQVIGVNPAPLFISPGVVSY